MASYLRRVFVLPEAWEERFAALQWAQGCAGVELRSEGERVMMTVYFAPDRGPEPFPADSWADEGIELLEETSQQDEDWAAEYRRTATPVEVAGLVLDPRDADDPALEVASGVRYLRLPARTAFGTGSHASTRLTLELVAGLEIAGSRVLDVGTGTGVLAFAAHLWGAAIVLAHDVDTEAVMVARQNASLNGIRGVGFFAGRLLALGASCDRSFDLFLVNILPHRIEGELVLLGALAKPQARVVVSGWTVEVEGSCRQLLENQGWHLEARRQEEEWVAALFRRVALP